MNWSTAKLGSLGEFRNGLNYSKANFGAGLRVISVKDFGDRSIPDLSIVDEINPAGLSLEKALLKLNDILFVRSNGNRDLVGRSLRIDCDYENLAFSAFCIRFRASKSDADPVFLSYFFRTPTFRRSLSLLGKGTNINNLNQEIMQTLDVPAPPRPVQQRVVDILSAYDDLIENNRRRMGLLEEAARQLYREWFVRLRFPGHEHTRITNGVPEGWREVRFEEVLVDLESGGRPRGGATNADGVPSIGAENVLGIGQYDYSKEKFVPQEYFEKMTRGVVRNRDVVLYKDGANVGRASYFGEGFPHEKCAVNEHVFILRTQPFVGQSFLYFWMIRDENRQAVANLNANTAQPGISQEKLKGLRLVLPRERLTRAFNEAVDPQVKQIFALALINQKLRAARDLLLPRLMSGEIAV